MATNTSKAAVLLGRKGGKARTPAKAAAAKANGKKGGRPPARYWVVTHEGAQDTGTVRAMSAQTLDAAKREVGAKWRAALRHGEGWAAVYDADPRLTESSPVYVYERR